MKSIAVVALIAYLALSTHVALADDCDNGECTSTVAVQQTFASPDCSGNATLSISNNYTNPCSVEAFFVNISTSTQCSAKAGLVSAVTVNTTSCSKVSTTYFSTAAVGVCIQHSSQSSYINWCNQASITNNFKAAKPITNETVFHPIGDTRCNATGCPNTATLSIYEQGDKCQGNVSLRIPASVFVQNGYLDLDVCYTTNGTLGKRGLLSSHYEDGAENVMITCSNGRFNIISSAGGCGSGSNYLGTVSYPTDTCILLEGYGKISCPSAASALIAGPFAFILLAAVLLFI